MKTLNTTIIAFVLLMSGFSVSLYADESQAENDAKQEQTEADDKSSDKKKGTEEEPECD